jgi:hypothetical protein
VKAGSRYYVGCAGRGGAVVAFDIMCQAAVHSPQPSRLLAHTSITTVYSTSNQDFCFGVTLTVIAVYKLNEKLESRDALFDFVLMRCQIFGWKQERREGLEKD